MDVLYRVMAADSLLRYRVPNRQSRSAATWRLVADFLLWFHYRYIMDLSYNLLRRLKYSWLPGSLLLTFGGEIIQARVENYLAELELKLSFCYHRAETELELSFSSRWARAEAEFELWLSWNLSSSWAWAKLSLSLSWAWAEFEQGLSWSLSLAELEIELSLSWNWAWAKTELKL